jgi:hypothetical protein
VDQGETMHQLKPDCRDCVRYDEQAAKDPHYVCTANHRPFPRECWDSHAKEQPAKKERHESKRTA